MKRLKHGNRLWRERRDWKQIRKDVGMDYEAFLQRFCQGTGFVKTDLEAAYRQAEKEVKEFIEECLVEKYGPEVRTLEDRYSSDLSIREILVGFIREISLIYEQDFPIE